MNSKQSAKRSPASRDCQENNMESKKHSVEKEENELLKFLQWNKELDPVSVAMVATQLDVQACSGESKGAMHDARQARRETLVRAMMLLNDARDIVTNGPTLEDLPEALMWQ